MRIDKSIDITIKLSGLETFRGQIKASDILLYETEARHATRAGHLISTLNKVYPVLAYSLVSLVIFLFSFDRKRRFATMEDSTVRQRKHQQAEQSEVQTPVKKKRRVQDEDEEDDYTPWVDILRVISFLLLASFGLSYVTSGGDSWWWGVKNKPDYMTVNYWKDLVKGPVEFLPGPTLHVCVLSVDHQLTWFPRLCHSHRPST